MLIGFEPLDSKLPRQIREQTMFQGGLSPDYTASVVGEISMFCKEELCKPWILITVSSKSVEKCGSCWRLYICKWTVMEAAIM